MPTILLVDDTPVDRRLAGGILEADPTITIEYAADGQDALNHCAASLPDLILTDMQMPNMDGLELVTQLNLQYPMVPVVLMTAHGSEDVAVEALSRGATSYVPKSQLSRLLLSTIQPILTMAESDEGYRRLVACSTRHEFSFMLENDTSLIDPLVGLVQKVVDSMGVCEYIEKVRMGVALEQALLNAIIRGNLELTREETAARSEHLLENGGADIVTMRRNEPPYQDRRVYVDARITREQACFVIRDEGPGFDTATIPRPRTAEAMRDDVGRGLVLMQTFMDEVNFNDVGNEVTMIKRPAEK